MTAARKPHAGNAGYVCERKARLGGHIVVYDRSAGFEIDADHRWIVMHEPSSNHIAIRTEREARQLMKDCAEARAIEEAPADIFPSVDQPDLSGAPAAAAATIGDAELPALEDLVDRFMEATDPEAERAARQAIFSGQWKRGGRR